MSVRSRELRGEMTFNAKEKEKEEAKGEGRREKREYMRYQWKRRRLQRRRRTRRRTRRFTTFRILFIIILIASKTNCQRLERENLYWILFLFLLPILSRLSADFSPFSPSRKSSRFSPARRSIRTNHVAETGRKFPPIRARETSAGREPMTNADLRFSQRRVCYM